MLGNDEWYGEREKMQVRAREVRSGRDRLCNKKMTFEQTLEGIEEVLYAHIYMQNIPGAENNLR